jgi:hypothetical protein
LKARTFALGVWSEVVKKAAVNPMLLWVWNKTLVLWPWLLWSGLIFLIFAASSRRQTPLTANKDFTSRKNGSERQNAGGLLDQKGWVWQKGSLRISRHLLHDVQWKQFHGQKSAKVAGVVLAVQHVKPFVPCVWALGKVRGNWKSEVVLEIASKPKPSALEKYCQRSGCRVSVSLFEVNGLMNKSLGGILECTNWIPSAEQDKTLPKLCQSKIENLNIKEVDDCWLISGKGIVVLPRAKWSRVEVSSQGCGADRQSTTLCAFGLNVLYDRAKKGWVVELGGASAALLQLEAVEFGLQQNLLLLRAPRFRHSENEARTTGRGFATSSPNIVPFVRSGWND